MATDALPMLDTGQSRDRFHPSPRWRMGAAAATLLAIALGTGSFVRLPYYSIVPGPARDVVGLVHVTGERTYPVRGALLLTTVAVSGRAITLYDGLASLFDPATELIPSSSLLGGHTPQQEDEFNVARMLESKYAAAVVALRAIGRQVPSIPGGRLVYVFPDSPSSRVLKNGDVVTAVDGKPVADIQALSAAIRKHTPGDTLRLAVDRGGVRHTFTIGTTTAKDESGKSYAAIGVWLAPAFRLPVDIAIDTQDIGGPSGGLVFALTIADVLTPGDLTKGHKIGVTGTIDIGGNVGEIGGIEQKVRAAERAGADVFIAPASEAIVAQRVSSKIRVVGVKTFAEAYALLQTLTPR